jgi:hypothetical protein
MATEDDAIQPGLGTQAVTGALAAAAGARLGGVLGAAAGAGATPYLVALVDNVRDEWRRDQREHIAKMAEAAAEAAGYSPEELGQQMGRSRRTRLLTATAAEAASKTAWPPKVIALGKALAAGLIAEDHTRIDTEQLALLAMAGMERPHVAVLDLIVHYWPYWLDWDDPPSLKGVEPVVSGQLGPTGWPLAAIAQARPQLAPAVISVMGLFQMHGLVLEARDRWHPTPLAKKVLTYYEQAGAETS